ncbi:MAG: thioredoxin [Alphaproteobacteria bacterium]|nr:thioredoxin [Alphaproteobacteria bacterium]
MEPIIGENAAPDGLVKDTTTATFMADVIEASRETPVIVDFWAPWCGPCKQLGPIIEKAVASAQGAVKLVKINIDENKEIAAQMRIQSIPAVFAFSNGQPVDGFVGAQPESQIKSFIERVVQAAGGSVGPSPVEQALEQAAEAEAAGDAQTAGAIYGEILKHEPDNLQAVAGLARSLLAAGQNDAARQLIDDLPPASREDADIKSAIAAMELADKAGEAVGQLAELESRVAANEADHQARFDLAIAYYAANKAEDAIDNLLTIVQKNRAWNDDAARKQLIEIFDALGSTDPLVADSRRRLSTILFS